MYKVISQWKVGKYLVLNLNQKLPSESYTRYRIDGEEYDSVPVYDLPGNIAIETKERDFVGKNVEFI